MFRPGNIGHVGRLGLVAASRNVFHPLSLFSSGEVGVWYDPSDLSTLFQDSAGTTPVTSVGQSVGRMLDKSGQGNHAFMATSADRPILRQDAGGRYYLEAVGSSTRMQTGSVNFTSTDNLSVFLAVRKLSDSSPGTVVELSTNATSGANPGSFTVRAPGGASATYSAWSSGTLQVQALSPTAYPSPDTRVLSMLSAIAGKTLILRANGSQIASTNFNQGTGNYGNYPLFLFRRSDTSLPFNGHFYGLLIRSKISTTEQLVNMERWLATKSGVTI
jgi:hypothetical protein